MYRSAFTLALAAVSLLAAGQDTNPVPVQIPKVSAEPRIEDYLSESGPHPGAMIAAFRQREPGDGSPASRATTAYLSYDDDHLYAVFVCQDDPNLVRAHMSKRDDTWNDDSVSLYLDTFHDGKHAYAFSVNPLGIQTDSLVTEGSPSDASFDTLWNAHGRLTADGYIVWMAIPFKSLRFSNTQSQTWGVALERSILRNGENSFWPYITLSKQGFVPQMGAVTGMADLATGRNIQLIPYIAGTTSQALDYTSGRLQPQNDFRAGMDAKIVLHNAFSLDVMLNPDFSQVESDDPQVTINQRYEVYFPEKRPFFLENAGYFQTPINLFFSRRIVDPEVGVRLTGKIGDWAIGLLGTDDRSDSSNTTVSTTNSAWFSGKRATNAVAHVQREFGKQSYVGFLFTDHNFGLLSNQVYSAETKIYLSPTWSFTGQLVHSDDRDSTGTPRHGSGGYAELLRTGRHFSYSLDYLDLGPNFRTDLGYVKRVDIRQVQQYAGYFWRPEDSPVVSIGPSVTLLADWDHTGVLQDLYADGEFTVDLKGQTSATLSRFNTFERYLGIGFEHQRSGISFSNGSLKWLYFYGSFGNGTLINYNPAWPVMPFVGRGSDASFGMTLRPSPRLKIDETYYFTSLKSPQSTVYDSHLLRTKVNYQFSKALSVRAILDYDAMLTNTALIAQDRTKVLTGDVLLTYLLNPGTALYFGYTNSHENLIYDPTAPINLMRTGPPGYLTDAQIFVKLSYLLRF